MKGYTLIEVILVISIIAFLSLIGVTKFDEFRKEAVVGLAADEFASEIKSARSMSVSGEVKEGETASDFETDGLPSYGVSVSGNSYEIFREFKSTGSSVVIRENIDGVVLDPSFKITGSSGVKFTRIKGGTSGADFVIEKTGVSEKRRVNVSSDGIVTVSKL